MTTAPDPEDYRLVWRAAAAAARTPWTVTGTCSKCSQQVLVDRVTTPDPPGKRLPLICVPCALADPGKREDVIKTWAAARLFEHLLFPETELKEDHEHDH